MFKYLMPILLVVAGGAMVVDSLRTASLDAAFEQRAETARIEPIDDYETYVHTKRGRRQPGNLLRDRVIVGYSHAAQISFVTSKGEQITLEKQGLPQGYVEASRSRKPVLIWYLPEEPTKVRLREGKQTSDYMIGIGLLILALGLVQGWRTMAASQPTRLARARMR